MDRSGINGLIIVGRELSFRKATAQSSTRKFPAVEDEGDVYVIDEGCISTDISTDPWWMMDLGKLYSIQRIQIHSPENNDTRGRNDPVGT